MITWILIIFVLSGHGQAVTSVPGFASAQECAEAARVVGRVGNVFQPVQAVCVRQTVAVPLPPERKP